MQRNNAGANMKWDFTYLYQTTEAWQADLAYSNEIVTQITKLKGHLSDKTAFLQYVNYSEQHDRLIIKLSYYLHLGDLDTTNQQYQQMQTQFFNIYQQQQVHMTFINSEIIAVGKDKVIGWLAENKPQYVYPYKRFFEEAKHVLDEKTSSLLATIANSRSAAIELYSTLAYADNQKEYITYQQKEMELTPSVYIKLMQTTDPKKDQRFRMEMAKQFMKNYWSKKHSFAKVYEKIIATNLEDTKLHHYDNFLEAELASDKVDPATYKKLITIGHASSGLIEKFYKVLQASLQLDEFYTTDVELLLADYNEKQYCVDEAKKMIKEALQPLGAKYLTYLDKAWSDSLVDYYADTNKRDGAYSSGGDETKPIILMNWDDSLRSVETLAHEIGHSIHTLIADEAQTYPLNHYPILLAEIASTLNEHLLFAYLYEKATSREEKIHLMQKRISNIIGTFFRQIQFAEFEYAAHCQLEANKPVSTDIFVQLFRDINKKYHQHNVVKESLFEESRYSWPRILHFFQSPFYVYKYATAITASFKLYDDVKKGNIANVMSFLQAGGSDEPLGILKSVGVDFTQESMYKPLLIELERLIVQLAQLLNVAHVLSE